MFQLFRCPFLFDVHRTTGPGPEPIQKAPDDGGFVLTWDDLARYPNGLLKEVRVFVCGRCVFVCARGVILMHVVNLMTSPVSVSVIYPSVQRDGRIMPR